MNVCERTIASKNKIRLRYTNTIDNEISNYIVAVRVAVVCSILALFFLLFYINFKGNPVQTPQAHLSSLQVPGGSCGVQDKSFCQIENKFNSLVSTNDVSDMLENQSYIDVTCSENALLQPYCASLASGLQLQIFKITVGNTDEQLTRNKYIQLLMTYFENYGPFHLTSITDQNNEIVMKYNGREKTQYLYLQFNKANNSQWHFDEPEIVSDSSNTTRQ